MNINIDDWVIEHEDGYELVVNTTIGGVPFVERRDGEELIIEGEYYERIYLNLKCEHYGWADAKLPLSIRRKSEIPVMEPIETEVGGLGLF